MPGGGPPVSRGAAAEGAPPPIVDLELAECHEIILRQRMGVISMLDAGGPYAVPVYYGFDGDSLYLGVSEGRKTRALDADPRVFITIVEPGEGDRWRSVAIAGRARSVTDAEERARGIEVLIAHNRRPERIGASGVRPPAVRRSGGRILRIEDAVITGRARR